MDESFGITWEDSSTVAQNEEVICGMENDILPDESDEFTGITEEIVDVDVEQQEPDPVSGGQQIMYLPDGNVIVMNEAGEQIVGDEEQFTEESALMDVTEEVITDQWGENCPEEIIVGSEEAVVGDVETQAVEDCDIPLPTDQDEYTAARPYPCDFCSRRFRKKANLMNHMVAHQTDRPHGCNLCGIRYVRKNDLMNHLKVHAYMPDGDPIPEDDLAHFDESSLLMEKPRKKRKYTKRKKKVLPIEKQDFNEYEVTEAAGKISAASGSQSYTYDDEMNFVESMENNSAYLQSDDNEIRYPITDPNKPFVCQHCGVGFAREKALASHAKIHAGDSPFECQKCGDMFWDISQMREHARAKHGEIDDYDDDEDGDYSEEIDDTGNRFGTFYCSTCGLSFHRQDNLKKHEKQHIKEEYVNSNEFGHICNVCGESFQEALDLLAHAEIHARDSDHRCMVCGELCQDETTLSNHVHDAHGNDLPPNTCMSCGRTCKDSRALLKHSWEHSKEKIFSCSICKKTFYNNARLKRHMLSHRNKNVSCDVCGEEFPDGRSLMNHRHSHSSVSGRQFPCRECGKTFGSRSSQQIHIRIHTGERPYGCRFCWKAFADGGTLRKHERIHTGEKPYACAVCPRAFNQRVVLREHIRSHHSGPDPKYSNSMTPYCCAVCSDMFATSQDLILHLIHHCDMNTAMKRQPQVGPRKYKRRRKLKPHELELLATRYEVDPNEEPQEEIHEEVDRLTESEEEPEPPKRATRRTSMSKKALAAAAASVPIDESPKHTDAEALEYSDLYYSTATDIENMSSIMSSKSPPTKASKNSKKGKAEGVVSRPKMIHTQKTRVPVETGEDGRVRHKTKTMITRTQPTEIKSATGERIRPRTKNVSYHILNPDKLPVATFPENEPEQAVQNLLREAENEQQIISKQEMHYHDDEQLEECEDQQFFQHTNGDVFMPDQLLEQPPEVAAEQIVETEGPVPVTLVEIAKVQRRSLRNRNVIAPGSKVRLIKEGMIISKVKKYNVAEPESILPDIHQTNSVFIKEEHYLHSETDENPNGDQAQTDYIDHHQEEFVASMKSNQNVVNVKQEMLDPSALHEFAEISMQHANSHNMYKCEMCSEVFSDRGQLLVHVPIHI